jgi:hypothetical protein
MIAMSAVVAIVVVVVIASNCGSNRIRVDVYNSEGYWTRNSAIGGRIL